MKASVIDDLVAWANASPSLSRTWELEWNVVMGYTCRLAFTIDETRRGCRRVAASPELAVRSALDEFEAMRQSGRGT